MNPALVLGLLGSLYGQIVELQQENARLVEQLADAHRPAEMPKP